MRRIPLLLIIVLVITVCRGQTASTDTDQTPAAVEVHAAGFLFKPERVVVEAGATVTWSNDDDILHTVTSGAPESADDGFDQELDGRSTSTSIVFNEPGEYGYFCSRHPHVTGVIAVEEPSP